MRGALLKSLNTSKTLNYRVRMEILNLKIDVNGIRYYQKAVMPTKYFSRNLLAKLDENFEEHRNFRNKLFLKNRLEPAFAVMEKYAQNGFQYLSKKEQNITILTMKELVRRAITEKGDFYQSEFENMIQDFNEKIERIYFSYMKYKMAYRIKKEKMLEQTSIAPTPSLSLTS